MPSLPRAMQYEASEDEDTVAALESADERMPHPDGGRMRAKATVGLLCSVGVLLLMAAAVESWPAAARSPPPTPAKALAEPGSRLPQLQAVSAPITQCPGSSFVGGSGLGNKELVNTRIQTKDGLPAEQVDVLEGAVVPHLGGRTYFADWCNEGTYDNAAYMSVPLLGKTLQFTVHLAGTGCGCNVALYLTAMKQNTEPTACQDHYCDANSVCGIRCDEVDIMEANAQVWRSTLHLAEDNTGGAAGFGGTGPHTQTWTSEEYGPEGRCIDTDKPFEVHAHFPVHNGSLLQGMMIDLAQEGSSCGLTATVGMYTFAGRDGLAELSKSLAAGMVPIISYWSSKNLQWLDGKDINGDEPCKVDTPQNCPTTAPRIWGLQMKDFTGFIHPSTMHLKPTTLAPTPAPTLAPTPMPALTPTPATPAPGAFTTETTAGGVSAAAAAAGWRKVERLGQVYFYNTRTMQASWNLPSVVAV